LESVAEEELSFGSEKGGGATQSHYQPIHSQPVPHRTIVDDYFVPNSRELSGALETL